MALRAPQYTELSMLHDAHGAPLLRQLYNPAEQLLYCQWFGNLTPETVITAARANLAVLQKLHAPLLLNDKTVATGDWTEAMPWVEFEWAPLAHEYGLRAFAYVFAPDVHNQLAALEVFTLARQQLAVRLFHNVETARAWLRQQLR